MNLLLFNSVRLFQRKLKRLMVRTDPKRPRVRAHARLSIFFQLNDKNKGRELCYSIVASCACNRLCTRVHACVQVIDFEAFHECEPGYFDTKFERTLIFFYKSL